MGVFWRRQVDRAAVDSALPGSGPEAAAGPAAHGSAPGNAHSAAPATDASTLAAAPARHWHLSWKLRVSAYATMALGVASLLWLGGTLIYYTIAVPNPRVAGTKEHAPIIRILARDGTLIGERGGAHDYVPISLIPRHVIDAVIATEDRRFYQHWGVDPAGLARATFANLRAGRFVQGGSTLTQQLAKNMFLSSERTVSRKLDEFALAIWLEVRLSKSEILELYLNRVYFGAGAYGIEAAAQRYFDKSVRALTVAEAALIAGLLKAPSKYSPTSSRIAALSRAHSVLHKMHDAGVIDAVTFEQARQQNVKFAGLKSERATSGFEHAIDLILEKLPPVLGEENAEMIVETTIDSGLQRRANALLQGLLDGRGKAMKAGQAALVALDSEGGIRALIGGRSYADSQFNRATKARRQPGSVFKPFVYLTAIERGMTPDTMTYDLPLTIEGWSPRNDNNQHVGPLSLRQALAQSVNTVAVRLAMDAGLSAVSATARRLGIQSELREDASMALGTSEMTLLELTGAYGVLANGGRRVVPHLIRRVRLNTGRVLYAHAAPAAQRVVAERDVGAMSDMLNAALVAGTGRRAALPRHPAAGKTGTTQDYRDAWFIGYTAHMTTGIWIGNDDGTPMARVMGGNLPAEVWREVMVEAHRDLLPVALPGTASSDRVAGADMTPIARSEAADMVARLAPGPSVTSSIGVRGSHAVSAKKVRRAAAATPSAATAPVLSSAPSSAPSTAPLPARAASRAKASPALAARPAGKPGLYLVEVAPTPTAPAAATKTAPSPQSPPAKVTATATATATDKTRAPAPAAVAARHPSERISADFLARVLQEKPEPAVGPAVASAAAATTEPVAAPGTASSGGGAVFDIEAIARSIEALPDRARPRSDGMMALGAGGGR